MNPLGPIGIIDKALIEGRIAKKGRVKKNPNAGEHIALGQGTGLTNLHKIRLSMMVRVIIRKDVIGEVTDTKEEAITLREKWMELTTETTSSSQQ